MLSLVERIILTAICFLSTVSADGLRWSSLPTTFQVGVPATLAWTGGSLSEPYNITLNSACTDGSCAELIKTLGTYLPIDTLSWTPTSNLDLTNEYYIVVAQASGEIETNQFKITAAAASNTNGAILTTSVGIVIPVTTPSSVSFSGTISTGLLGVSTEPNLPQTPVTGSALSTPSASPSTSETISTLSAALTPTTSSASSTPSSSSTTSITAADSTSTPTSASPANATVQSSSTLSDSAKIGIGVGVGVGGAIILAAIAFLLFKRRSRASRNNRNYEKDRMNGRQPGVGIGMHEPGVAVDF